MIADVHGIGASILFFRQRSASEMRYQFPLEILKKFIDFYPPKLTAYCQTNNNHE